MHVYLSESEIVVPARAANPVIGPSLVVAIAAASSGTAPASSRASSTSASEA